jgi:hypothetical protein
MRKNIVDKIKDLGSFHNCSDFYSKSVYYVRADVRKEFLQDRRAFNYIKSSLPNVEVNITFDSELMKTIDIYLKNNKKVSLTLLAQDSRYSSD